MPAPMRLTDTKLKGPCKAQSNTGTCHHQQHGTFHCYDKGCAFQQYLSAQNRQMGHINEPVCSRTIIKNNAM